MLLIKSCLSACMFRLSRPVVWVVGVLLITYNEREALGEARRGYLVLSLERL